MRKRSKQVSDFIKGLSLLLHKGNLGNYKFAKVDQIVLLTKGKVINYFTNVTVSSRIMSEEQFRFLTSSPKTISDGLKIAISSYAITVSKLKRLLSGAATDGKWNYDQTIVQLDSIFVTPRKFIPENDPTGSKYNNYVPIELYLYGSNCNGNYYMIELFSKKEEIKTLLGAEEIQKIQKYIKECHLNYNLSRLQDRIGNVVCKVEVENFSHKPSALGYDRGIGLELKYSKTIEKHGITLSVVQEHDRAIYSHEIISDFKGDSLFIEPNQCKTQVSFTDNQTGLILFEGVYDYQEYSDYYSQIGIPYIVSTFVEPRILHFSDHDEIVNLSGIRKVGNRFEYIEMALAAERKKTQEDAWVEDYGYFKSYSEKQHSEAIKDIIEIINARDLLWDLEEICVIDPYLTGKDIASTVFFCKKPNIKIRALCSYRTLKDNKETKNEIDSSSTIAFIEQEKSFLESILGKSTDIRLIYRTISNGHGLQFHDRYIILNFNINRSRVWMLGSSINSIGDAHSVIQIVEAPNKIIELFEKQWELTSEQECQIFDNSIPK